MVTNPQSDWHQSGRRRSGGYWSGTASERGAVDIWMLLMLSLLIAFAGFALDMGMLFNTRREATNVAAAAARAAANEVDPNSLYDDGVSRQNRHQPSYCTNQRLERCRRH